MMLLGEYQHSFDPKGRIAIPAKFRDELGSSVVVNLSVDEQCLCIYSLEKYEKEAERINEYSSNKSDIRALKRVFFSQASQISFDSQGRILVPTSLAEKVDLKKECIIIGQFDHLEMWNVEKWNSYFEQQSKKTAEISENLDD